MDYRQQKNLKRKERVACDPQRTYNVRVSVDHFDQKRTTAKSHFVMVGVKSRFAVAMFKDKK